MNFLELHLLEEAKSKLERSKSLLEEVGEILKEQDEKLEMVDRLDELFQKLKSLEQKLFPTQLASLPERKVELLRKKLDRLASYSEVVGGLKEDPSEYGELLAYLACMGGLLGAQDKAIEQLKELPKLSPVIGLNLEAEEITPQITPNSLIAWDDCDIWYWPSDQSVVRIFKVSYPNDKSGGSERIQKKFLFLVGLRYPALFEWMKLETVLKKDASIPEPWVKLLNDCGGLTTQLLSRLWKNEPRSDLEKKAIDLLNKMNALWRGATWQGQTPQEQRQSSRERTAEIFSGWFDLCTDFLELDIRPPVTWDKDKKRLFFGTIKEHDSLRKTLKQLKVVLRRKATADESFTAGQIIGVSCFWHSGLSLDAQQKIDWCVSIGDCPERIEKVGTLSEFHNLGLERVPEDVSRVLESWRRFTKKLLTDPAEDRLQKFESKTQACAKELGQSDDSWLDSLIRKAFGLDDRGQSSDAGDPKAKAWFEALCAYMKLQTYPRLEDGTWIWPPESLEKATLFRFDARPDKPFGSLLECERFSLTPEGARVTISLGPEKELPALFAVQKLRQLLRDVSDSVREEDRTQVENLKEIIDNQVNEETRLAIRKKRGQLTDEKWKRRIEEEVPDALRKILESYIKLSANESFISEKSQIFCEHLTSWARCYDWQIVPPLLPQGEAQVAPDDPDVQIHYAFHDRLSPGTRVIRRYGLRHQKLGISCKAEIFVFAGQKPRHWDELCERLKQFNFLTKFLQELKEWPREICELRRSERDAKLADLGSELYQAILDEIEIRKIPKD